MNKLREFYETTQQRVPFNELSVESMDILEQSDAYKSYLKLTPTSEMIKSIKPVIKRIKREALINNLKYIGNVLLCGFMAILLVIFACYHVIKNDRTTESHKGIITYSTSTFQESDTVLLDANGSLVTYEYIGEDTTFISVIKRSK